MINYSYSDEQSSQSQSYRRIQSDEYSTSFKSQYKKNKPSKNKPLVDDSDKDSDDKWKKNRRWLTFIFVVWFAIAIYCLIGVAYGDNFV